MISFQEGFLFENSDEQHSFKGGIRHLHTFKSAETQKYIFLTIFEFLNCPRIVVKLACIIFVMHPNTEDV